MKYSGRIFLIAFLLTGAFGCSLNNRNKLAVSSQSRPNILLLLADDLGYGELGCYGQKIILITSDNGPQNEGGHDHEFFNSNRELKGFKRDLYEGGIRVPLIVYWNDKIPAGRVSDHIAEKNNLAEKYPEIVSEIDGLFGEAHAETEFFPYGGVIIDEN